MKKTKLSCFGYHIDPKEITNEQYRKIIDELTVYPYKMEITPEEIQATKFSIYKKTDDGELIVPRYYGISRFGKPQTQSFDSEEIDIHFTKTLREKQQIVCDQAIKYIKRNGGGLLSVPCGFGKTICALYIVQKLGLKTLVVVHKSFLIKQWIKNALEFLDISESKIGIIRQKKCDIIGKDIVFGMIQTIAKEIDQKHSIILV